MWSWKPFAQLCPGGGRNIWTLKLVGKCTGGLEEADGHTKPVMIMHWWYEINL